MIAVEVRPQSAATKGRMTCGGHISNLFACQLAASEAPMSGPISIGPSHGRVAAISYLDLMVRRFDNRLNFPDGGQL
jgi:hypothetical protein